MNSIVDIALQIIEDKKRPFVFRKSTISPPLGLSHSREHVSVITDENDSKALAGLFSNFVGIGSNSVSNRQSVFTCTFGIVRDKCDIDKLEIFIKMFTLVLQSPKLGSLSLREKIRVINGGYGMSVEDRVLLSIAKGRDFVQLVKYAKVFLDKTIADLGEDFIKKNYSLAGGELSKSDSIILNFVTGGSSPYGGGVSEEINRITFTADKLTTEVVDKVASELMTRYSDSRHFGIDFDDE